MTAATDEAMELLQSTRRALIDRGRVIATRLARENGSVNSREVYEEMRDEIPDGVSAVFLSAVFRNKLFAWDGDLYDGDLNPHRGKVGSLQPIKVWRLADGA